MPDKRGKIAGTGGPIRALEYCRGDAVATQGMVATGGDTGYYGKAA